jgi:thiosulfate dehydrogenase [quinone] large subunit
MSDPTSSPAAARRCEYTAAFLLLRLFLGLRTFLAGLQKFEAQGHYSRANYATNMGRMAEYITTNSFLKLWMTRDFAFSLGYLMVGLGVLILLGIKTRIALFLTGLVYVGLAFGLMVVQEDDGIAWLGVYIGLFAAALVLVRHDRFALWRDRIS